MNPEKYIEKNGFIYGVSYKFEFGKFDFSRIQKFTNLEDAEKWLHTEEYDFRTRELMSKSAAIAFAGKEAVDYAETNFGNATEPAVPQKHRKIKLKSTKSKICVSPPPAGAYPAHHPSGNTKYTLKENLL